MTLQTETAENSKLKQLQTQLGELALSVVGAMLNTLDKYRNLCLFIRENHVALHGTENQTLIAAGINKASASEIVAVALDTTNDQFTAFLGGEGFRVALKQAREEKAPDAKTPRAKKKANSKIKGKSTKGSSARAADFNLFAKKLAVACNNLAAKGEISLPWSGEFEGLTIYIGASLPAEMQEEGNIDV